MEEKDKYKWLFDDMEGMREKIKFKNRIEFRVSGQLHNTLGPALIELEPEKNRYYINGREYSEDDWVIAVRPAKLKRLKRKIESKKKKGENNNGE